MQTLYLCDGKIEKCLGVEACHKTCFHTSKVKHAINGPCKRPENNRERFKAMVARFGDCKTEVQFWERMEYEANKGDQETAMSETHEQGKEG